MTGTLRYENYPAPHGVPHGRAEMLARVGPIDATRMILIVPPLFEEHNRLRRTLMLAMRALAGRGVASALIDLPGQNESETPLEQVRLADWREAVGAAARAAGATHVASLRGGALIDDMPGLPVWRLAPTTGAKIMNVIARAQIAADKQAGLVRSRDDIWRAAKSEPVQLGGKLFTPGLLADLRAAEPADVAALEEAIAPPLWLRVEPGESTEFAQAMADALDRWSDGAA